MVKEICYHMLVGLNYLYRELSIIHTDLKPKNVLLFLTTDPSKNPTTLVLPSGKEKTVITLMEISSRIKRKMFIER